MSTIRNVQIGTYDIDGMILSTSGVSSCIAVVIEAEEKIFIYHADPHSFNASSTCTSNDAYIFLMNIFNYLHELDKNAIVKNIFLIGGWNNTNYMNLRNQINLLCDQYTITTEQHSALSSDKFHLLLNKIKFNLIGFNLPAKNPDGNNKEENDDDNPDDYLFDITIIYDRSKTLNKFLILQYGGRDGVMNADRSDSLLQAVYEVDPISKNLQAFLCSNEHKSPYYDEFLKQVLLNVKNQCYIHHSLNDIIKKNIDDLLSRIESKSLFNKE